MSRRARALLALAAALTLAATACLPIGQIARDLADTSDGATLSYRQRTADHPSGLLFDPGPELAVGVAVVARGTAMVLIETPADATCWATDTRIDCLLGDRAEPVAIDLAGRGVLAAATYRRAGSTAVYQAIAR